MYFYFKTSTGIIKTYICFEGYFKAAEIIGDNQDFLSSQIEPLYNNAAGDLAFRYCGEEVVVRKVETTNMDIVRSKMKSGEQFSSVDLVMAIICDGVENVRFHVMPPACDNVEGCVCKLRPEYLAMPHDGYMVKFVSVEPSSNYVRFFYFDDLISMIRDGQIKILDSIQDGKTEEEHLVEYFCEVTSREGFPFKMIAKA